MLIEICIDYFVIYMKNVNEVHNIYLKQNMISSRNWLQIAIARFIERRSDNDQREIFCVKPRSYIVHYTHTHTHCQIYIDNV